MNQQTDLLDEMLKDIKGKSWADIDEEEYLKSSFNVNNVREKNNGIQQSNSVSNETSSSSKE